MSRANTMAAQGLQTVNGNGPTLMGLGRSLLDRAQELNCVAQKIIQQTNGPTPAISDLKGGTIDPSNLTDMLHAANARMCDLMGMLNDLASRIG